MNKIKNPQSEIDDALYELDTTLTKIRYYVQDTATKLEQLDDILARWIEFKERMEVTKQSGLDDELIDNTIFYLGENAKESAPIILASEAADATFKSEEYSKEEFRVPLIEACSNPNSLRVSVTYSKWNSKLLVDNNLDDVAGTLDDWANGVQLVRNILEENRSEKHKIVHPMVATYAWREIFGTDKWSDTINARLIYSGKPAPFWPLLNYGTLNMKLKTDYGGFPYPSNPPTYFVERAIEILKETFLNELNSYKLQYEMFMENIDSYINLSESNISEIEGLKETMSMRLEEEMEGERDDEYALDIEYMVERSDEEKLIKLLTELTKEGRVTSFRVTKEGRVELTRPGGKRYRPYISTLIRKMKLGQLR